MYNTFKIRCMGYLGEAGHYIEPSRWFLNSTDFAESPTDDAEATAIMLQMSEVMETMHQSARFFSTEYFVLFFFFSGEHTGANLLNIAGRQQPRTGSH